MTESSHTPVVPTPANTPSGRSDARQNRARLLIAARDVLKEHGLHGEVTEIANRAEVGAGTLYRHFPSKDALIAAVSEELHAAILAELERASRIDDARDALAHVVRAEYGLVEDYGQLFLALMSGSGPATLYKAFDGERISGLIAQIIRRGIEQQHFRQDLDIDHAIGLIYALFAPISLASLMRQRSLEEIATASTDFILAGLAAPNQPSAPSSTPRGPAS
ncbi:MAG TPA: TetR/AcrR family transcriptional regulator [Dehalococcoidia bacterium]|nr:TetR/AcrR family transcriptional regulator [Dehalococcoidia bacterium]